MSSTIEREEERHTSPQFAPLAFRTLRETLCNACAALNVAERETATGLGVTVVSTSIVNALSPAAASLQRLISLNRARVTTRTEWPAIVSLCSSVISQPIETAAHRASSLLKPLRHVSLTGHPRQKRRWRNGFCGPHLTA